MPGIDGLHDHTYEDLYKDIQHSSAFVAAFEDCIYEVEDPKLVMNKVKEKAPSSQWKFLTDLP